MRSPGWIDRCCGGPVGLVGRPRPSSGIRRLAWGHGRAVIVGGVVHPHPGPDEVRSQRLQGQPAVAHSVVVADHALLVNAQDPSED